MSLDAGLFHLERAFSSGDNFAWGGASDVHYHNHHDDVVHVCTVLYIQPQVVQVQPEVEPVRIWQIGTGWLPQLTPSVLPRYSTVPAWYCTVYPGTTRVHSVPRTRVPGKLPGTYYRR